MAMESSILPRDDLVLTRASGLVDEPDLQAHHEALVSDPGFRPGLDQFCDLRAVKAVSVSSAALRRLAQVNPFDTASRRAIVVEPGDLLVYGLSRIYRGHASEDPDRLVVQFDHVDGALAWLGVDRAVLEYLPDI